MREAEIDLRLGDYLSLLRRRWRWVVGAVLLVTGLVALVTFTRDKVYESSVDIQVLTEGNQGIFNTRIPDLFRTGVSELQFMERSIYVDAVEERAGGAVEMSTRLRSVDPAEEAGDAAILRTTVQAPTAAEAVAGAGAAADAYLELRLARDVAGAETRLEAATGARDSLIDSRAELTDQIATATEAVQAATDSLDQSLLELDRENLVRELEPRIDSLSTQIGNRSAELGVVRDIISALDRPESTGSLIGGPTEPSRPISPNVPRNLAIAIVISLVLGIILAILRELLDPTAHDGAELSQLVDIPVMASIAQIPSQRSAPGGVRRYADLSPEESSGYQVLLNSLWLSNVDNPVQSIVFASDRPEVGKTQTVVNVAQAEASRGTRVLVIDTDFVNPTVASRLEMESPQLGLGDLLDGTATVESVVVSSAIDNVHFIDARGASGSGELLRSDRLAGVLATLYSSYDLILIDSAPTLSASDSRLVASQADAVLVVYDPALSRREELQRTIDLLRSARANLIGLVANRSRAAHAVYVAARER